MMKKIILLGAMYFVQGLPFGFQAKALPLLLREQGASLTLIGMVGVLALPWMAKIFWAPLVERHELFGLGRRRGWIVVGQIGIAVCSLLAALALNLGFWSVLFGLIFLMNVFCSENNVFTTKYAHTMKQKVNFTCRVLTYILLRFAQHVYK